MGSTGRKKNRAGEMPLSEQWLEGTGPVVPGSPPHASMGAAVLLDPAEAGTLAPPGPPALPQFMWGSGIMPTGGDGTPAPSPSTLKTPSQRAGLAAPCHGKTEAWPPHGITLPVDPKSSPCWGLVPGRPALSPVPWQPMPQHAAGMEATGLQWCWWWVTSRGIS